MPVNTDVYGEIDSDSAINNNPVRRSIQTIQPTKILEDFHWLIANNTTHTNTVLYPLSASIN